MPSLIHGFSWKTLFLRNSHCMDSNDLLPVILFFRDIDHLNPDTIEVGTVVIVEGIGEGLSATKRTSGKSVKAPVLSGTFLALDTTCTVKVLVRTQPSNIYLYLDRKKMSASSTYAVFENICPGVHILSALNLLGALIDRAKNKHPTRSSRMDRQLCARYRCSIIIGNSSRFL